MARLLKLFLFLCFISLCSCSSKPVSQTECHIKVQPRYETFSFYEKQDAEKDMELFRGPVKTVAFYDQRGWSTPIEIVGSDTLYQDNITTYTTQYKKLHVVYPSYKKEVFYYYNSHGNLYLKKSVDKYGEGNARIWYDEKGKPLKLLKYSVTAPEKEILYSGYEELSYQNVPKGIQVQRISVGSDTIRSEFSKEDVAIIDPQRMFLLEKGDSHYAYTYYGDMFLCTSEAGWKINRDETGRMMSKINKSSQRKEFYFYENNRIWRKEEVYSSESSHTETITVYDEYGNPTSERYKEPNHSSLKEYEYQYDEYGNWTQKIIYYTSSGDNKRVRKATELRKMSYYVEGEELSGKNEAYLVVSPEIQTLSENVPKWSAEKQILIDEYNRAVEAGEYGREVVIASASDIKDFTPRLWKIIAQADGDLDGDGVADKVVVYETPVEHDVWSKSNCLVIYKKRKGDWIFWYQSFNPVLSPEAGGMSTHTFQELGISDQTITISHAGLSSGVNYNFSHDYRYMNDDWRLVLYQWDQGNACNNYSCSFNLITGNIKTSNVDYDCKGEGKKESSSQKKYKHKFNVLPTMDDGVAGDRTLKISGTGDSILY